MVYLWFVDNADKHAGWKIRVRRFFSHFQNRARLFRDRNKLDRRMRAKFFFIFRVYKREQKTFCPLLLSLYTVASVPPPPSAVPRLVSFMRAVTRVHFFFSQATRINMEIRLAFSPPPLYFIFLFFFSLSLSLTDLRIVYSPYRAALTSTIQQWKKFQIIILFFLLFFSLYFLFVFLSLYHLFIFLSPLCLLLVISLSSCLFVFLFSCLFLVFF